MQRRLHVFISGSVQGVFFRAFIKEKADQLSIDGWIRNNPDGMVEAVFEGEKEKVDEMIKWCYKGSPGSMVEHVEMREEKIEGLGEFEVQ